MNVGNGLNVTTIFHSLLQSTLGFLRKNICCLKTYNAGIM